MGGMKKQGYDVIDFSVEPSNAGLDRKGIKKIVLLEGGEGEGGLQTSDEKYRYRYR